jgi:hypothetical protein
MAACFRVRTAMTADLLRREWGRALLILVGILVAAAGLEAGRRAVRLNFRERFAAEHMSRPLATVTRALGAFGLFCYGLYCLIEARYRDLTPGR